MSHVDILRTNPCEAHQPDSTVLRNHCKKETKRERQFIRKFENFKYFCLCGWVAHSFSCPRYFSLFKASMNCSKLSCICLTCSENKKQSARFRWEIVVQCLLGNTSYVKGKNINVGMIKIFAQTNCINQKSGQFKRSQLIECFLDFPATF